MGDGAGDDHPLRRSIRPRFEADLDPLRVVDLFSGCGGLTLGTAMAAERLGRGLDIRLAVDAETAATTVFSDNFPGADVRNVSIETLFSPVATPELTDAEVELAKAVGKVDVLLGGPPCQGHSNLNNYTRRNDPKNALYLYMVRAAKVLKPNLVVVENVPAVLHDTFGDVNVVEVARQSFSEIGYTVSDTVVSLVKIGVPQRRKRHILVATLSGSGLVSKKILAKLKALTATERTVRWAIGDLNRSTGVGFDAAPKASMANQARMQYLIDHKLHDLPNAARPKCHQGQHSYVSMYGRLRWKQPAQTITSGFGSIGQGRYMHPGQKRALTAHEAARLQGFPDFFTFASVTKRSDLSTMIGNAVPPQLTEAIVLLAYATE